MQSDLGKLFVGGISWDTNEERLKEYFNAYGEVVEAIIMKDRTTGRARGFGFVVFADPVVAERVIKEKHSIDGRMVEAKKAVPRDDQNVVGRNSGGGSSIHGGSPGQGRTRKIFVGGLASTVTETEFKKYFEQFGSITDVVVMYDHNTQRPRGFGFITYDCEEAVDRVLIKTFHELNGKMVEVKRAVPKELSPGPTSRSPLGVGGGAYPHYGLNRVLNGSYNTATPNGLGVGVGGFGVRMLDGRFSPIAPSNQQRGFQAFGSGYGGVGLNFDSVLSPGFGGNASFLSTSNNINNVSSNSVGYGREPNLPYYSGSNSNRFDGGSIGFDEGSSSVLGSRNLWGNININGGAPRLVPNSGSTNATGYGGGSGGGSSLGGGGNGFGLNWDPSPIISPQSHVGYGSGGGGDDTYSSELLGGSAGRNNSGSLYADGTTTFLGGGGLYRSASTSTSPYGGDTTWRTSVGERDGGAVPFGFGLADFPPKNSPGYVGGYTISKRQSARDDLSLK